MFGVFSYGELDKGIVFLLDKYDIYLSGIVLDFVCGVGVIGSYFKKCYFYVNFYFLDVSVLVIYCIVFIFVKNV